jgi:hypothetical protein
LLLLFFSTVHPRLDMYFASPIIITVHGGRLNSSAQDETPARRVCTPKKKIEKEKKRRAIAH